MTEGFPPHSPLLLPLLFSYTSQLFIIRYQLWSTASSFHFAPPPPPPPSLPLAVPSSTPFFFYGFFFFFRRKVQNVCCVGVAVVCFYNAFVGLGECLLCCVDILIWHCSKECRLVEIVFFFSFFLRLTRCNVESLFRNGYLTERPRSFLNFCAPTEFSAVWVYCKKQS